MPSQPDQQKCYEFINRIILFLSRYFIVANLPNQTPSIVNLNLLRECGLNVSRMGANVFQGTTDVGRDNWDVASGGDISVLVSSVLDVYWDSLGIGPAGSSDGLNASESLLVGLDAGVGLVLVVVGTISSDLLGLGGIVASLGSSNGRRLSGIEAGLGREGSGRGSGGQRNGQDLYEDTRLRIRT